jgi:ATP-binding cassette subfamily C (CFTR/MRP) protein 10
MSVLTFITYVQLGNQLTPAKVFTSLALFNMLIGPLNAFPWVINGLVQAWVSLKRVQNYLNLENLNWLGFYTLNELSSPSPSSSTAAQADVVIDIKNGEFTWKNEKQPRGDRVEFDIESGSGEPVLSQINVRIRRGDLVGVIGKVGSGKSSLLHSIIAEIEKSDGKVRVSAADCSRGFAYVGQESWVSAGTIRDNILFGAEMDRDRYDRVLEACALLPDLDLFPSRDETPVGENGLCLSGGQKARVSLARACYAPHKDIYVFDDPLSAVDAHVAKHIFNNCINGLLADKTRILCTHHFKYLTCADTVLVMDEGRVSQTGRGADIVPKLMQYWSLISSAGDATAGSFSGKASDEITSMDEIIKEEMCVDEADDEVVETLLTKLDEAEMKKRDEEEKEHGVIDYRVYKYYIYAVGIFLTVLTVLFLIMMQGKFSCFFFFNLRFAKCKTRRIVSEVKSSFTTVFSVLQNQEKLTWLRKKKIFFWMGFFHFLGILSKNRFFRLFSAKIQWWTFNVFLTI